MSNERRSVEIAISATIDDLVSTVEAGAAAVDRSATTMAKAGAKVDTAVATQGRSVGRLRTAWNSIGNTWSSASSKLSANAIALAKHKEQVDKISMSWLVAGGVIAAAVAGSVLAMANFDKEMSGVAATGTSARNSIEGLRQTALQAGMDTAYSASQAAAGITQLLKAGLSAEDVIAGGLTGALNLAAADNMAVADSAEIVATALGQFELSGQKATHVADLLASAAGKAQGGVTDLAMGLKYIGPVAHGMGISIEETVGALGAFASNGILGQQAGTSLRGVLSSLTSPSKQARAEMERLGIQLYDDQGAFLGLANVAGQLQKAYDGTGKLARKATAEQKDLSLGVMFGNAQLTAARVLFAKGADGIQEWIDKVDDAGYSARAAAIQLDNLQGDLQILRGTVESVGIKTGSGLNTFLRDTVQDVNKAVYAFGTLPAPVLEAGTRFAALAGFGLLAGGGMLKAATGAAEAKRSMAILRTESPKVARGLSAVSKAAGALGVAMAVIQVGTIFGQAYQDNLDKTRASLADVAQAVANLGAKNTVDGLNEQFDQLGLGVNDAATAFEKLRVERAKAGVGKVDMVDPGYALQSFLGIFGVKSPIDTITEQFDKMDQAMVSLDPEIASRAFKQIADGALASGTSLEELEAQFPQYKASLQAIATQFGIGDLSAKEWVDWMGGKVPEAVSIAAQAQPELTDKLTDTQKAALDTADSLSQLTASLWEYANAQLKLSGNQIGFEAARDDTRKTIKGNQKRQRELGTTSLDYKVNRENKKALDDLATSTQRYVNNLIEQNGKGKEAADVMAQARSDYIANAIAAGYGADEAKRMADDMGLIPANVRSDVELTGTEAAQQRTHDLGVALRGLPKKQQSEVESIFKTEGVTAAYEALSKIDKKKADAWIVSMLNSGAIKEWNEYKPETKHPKIDPQLTKSNFKINISASGSVRINGGPQFNSADGNLFTRRAHGLSPRRFADGGYAAIGGQQPQIRQAGGAGLTWAEDGAGPWEAFISGHPGKRARSRSIASDVIARLGGVAVFADGGILSGRPSGQQVQQSMSAPSVVNNYNIRTSVQYPQAEPTSVTNNRTLEYAAAIGR